MTSLPTPEHRFRAEELDAELGQQLHLLEVLFQDPGLTELRRRAASHPAVGTFDLIRQLKESPGRIQCDDHDRIVATVGRLLIERWAWAPGKIETDLLEELIPHAKRRGQIRSDLAIASKYGDIMAELYCLGWMRKRPWKANLNDEDSESLPDINIEEPANASAEVKRIHVGTKVSRIDSIVKKANRQLRNVSPATSGLLYIIVDREGSRATFDDRVPNDIHRYLAAVERRMRSDSCRSIGATVVVWDDFFMFTDRPERIVSYVRRRSATVKHSSAHAPVPSVLLSTEMGATAEIPISFQGSLPVELRSLETADVVVTQLFRETNEFDFGLRPSHVLEIVKEPDSEFNVVEHGARIRLWTRLVELAKTQCVLVVLGREQESGTVELDSAFQLFGSGADMAAWRFDPREAFMEVLRRYGTPISVGSQRGLLVEYAQIPGDNATVISAEGAGSSFLSSALVKRTDSPFGMVTEITWAFAIDTERYRTAVQVARQS
jgi:hypothetical protein